MTTRYFIDECHRFLRALLEKHTDAEINAGFTGLCHVYAKVEDSQIAFTYMRRCCEKYESWIAQRTIQ